MTEPVDTEYDRPRDRRIWKCLRVIEIKTFKAIWEFLTWVAKTSLGAFFVALGTFGPPPWLIDFVQHPVATLGRLFGRQW